MAPRWQPTPGWEMFNRRSAKDLSAWTDSLEFYSGDLCSAHLVCRIEVLATVEPSSYTEISNLLNSIRVALQETK